MCMFHSGICMNCGWQYSDEQLERKDSKLARAVRETSESIHLLLQSAARVSGRFATLYLRAGSPTQSLALLRSPSVPARGTCLMCHGGRGPRQPLVSQRGAHLLGPANGTRPIKAPVTRKAIFLPEFDLENY